MLIIRKILSITILLVLAACSGVPAEKSPDPMQIAPKVSQSEKTAPTITPSKAGTLADSLLAVQWKSSGEGHFLLPIDPATGQALAKYEPISLGQSYSYAFSSNRHTLAAVGFISAQGPNGGNLFLIDLETWKYHFQELHLNAYVSAMDFSPDGKQLAISYGNAESQILLVDVAQPLEKSESATQQISLDFLVNQMKFTSDGNGLMVYGNVYKNPSTVYQINDEPPIVTLLDSADLSIRWKANLEGIHHGIIPKAENSEEPVDVFQPGQAMYLYPGLAFAPQRNILYIVHPDEDKLTSVDFDAQIIRSVGIKAELSWFERLLSLTAGVAHAKVAEGTTKHVNISPDGKFLYIVGERNELVDSESDEWQINTIPLGLQVVRAEDGSRVSHYDTEASDVNISYDGQYLFLQGWSQADSSAWTQILDTETYQSVTPVQANTWLVPTKRLNGEPILASSVYINGEDQQHYTIVNPEDLTVLSEWSSTDYLVWLNVP